MPDLIERLWSRPQRRGRLRWRAPVGGRHAAGTADDGFVLLETMVAIAVITVIMTALTTLFVTVMGSTNHQRSAQAGAQLADSALDKAHGLGAAGAVKGRGSTAVGLQFSTAPVSVKTAWLNSMSQASDASVAATAGATADLPTTGVAQTINNKPFTVNYYVGSCNRQADGTCTTASGGLQYTRVVVAVTWNDHTCGTTGCAYVTATLLNGAADPVFEFNQAPPPQPHLATIANQTSAVADVVNGPTATTPTGVPPFVFTATGLPPGLAMNQAGLVSGTPTTQTGSPFTVTVTVTDGFLNTDTTTFTWTILPPLVFVNPGSQASLTTSAVSLKLTASGGTGTGYTWSATGLPAGLSMNAGTISGTPSASAVRSTPYTVSVTLKDSTGTRTFTDTFTWVISYPPFAAGNPGTQTSTVNKTVTTVTLTATGGSGSYTWTDANNTLPPGVSLSSSGVITGKPAASGSYNVKLSVSDNAATNVANNPQSVSFTWVVNAAPSITTPGGQSGEVSVSPALPAFTISGGSAPFTWSAGGLPTGVTMNSSGQLVGKPTAAGVFTTTVTITDKYGATASTSGFTWTIIAAPSINIPDRTTSYSTAVNYNLLPLTTGGAGPYTFAISNLPSGLSASAAGLITGTTKATASTKIVSVVVTDSAGATASDTFNWWVTDLSLAIPDQVTKPGAAISFIAPAATGGSGLKTYAASGLPGWLSFNTLTRRFSGTAPSTATNVLGIAVTVTDLSGSFTATLNWYVTTLSLNLPAKSTPKNTLASFDLATATVTSGGTTPYWYTVSALPSGLTFDGSHTITGTTANSTSSTTVTVTVTDATGARVSQSFTWSIT